MKRLIVFVLVLALVFAFTACNKKVEEAPEVSAAPETEVSIAPEVTEPPAEIPIEIEPDTLAPDYVPEEPIPEGAHLRTLTKLSIDENITFDPTEQGDAVTVYFYENDDALMLDIDGTAHELFTAETGYFVSAWLFMRDHVPTLLVTIDEASNDYRTIAYRIVENVPVKVSDTFGSVDSANDDGLIVMGMPVDVLGTWWALRNYDVDDDGRIAPIEGSLFDIIATDEANLVTKRTLPVEMMGEDGSYKASEVAANTRITPFATDDEQYLYFFLDSGEEGRIVFKSTEGGIMIGDLSESVYFDNLLYAG